MQQSTKPFKPEVISTHLRVTSGSRVARQLLEIVVMICGLIVPCALSGCSGCRDKKENETVKIGAVLPLTGSASVWGENTKNGMELALEELNAKGGINGKRIQIIYEDSQSQPKAAVSAFRKLIDTEKIPVVIGDVASSNVLAMAPVAMSERIVLISPGASNPDISKAGEYVFRNFPSDALEGKIDAKYAIDQLKWTRVAMISVKNAYGQGVSQVFKERLKELGGEVVFEESFEQGAIDFRGQLTSLKGVKADGVYLPGYPEEMGRLLKQAKEMGITQKFFSTQAFDDPQVLKFAGDTAEGVIFSTPEPPNESDPLVGEFRKKYRKRYDKEPGLMSDTGYDALRIVAHAIERGGYDSKKIKEELVAIRDFPGAAGKTTFDKHGDVPRPFMFKTVKGGKIVDAGFRMTGD